MKLIAAFAVTFVLICPASAQDTVYTVWSGNATFPDGWVEEWSLDLQQGIDDPSASILVDGGHGLKAANVVATASEIRFSVESVNVPPGFHCLLGRSGSDLAGSCADGDGQEVVKIDMAVQIERDIRPDSRPRARDIGLVVGVFRTGANNAITDVTGVKVGHVTIDDGTDIRTGITAVVPADGDLYARPVPAWIHSVNGYGKLIGETQVRELGEIETPILLTCTLCVWSAAKGLAWHLMEADYPRQHTINPVVGEVNDSWVNDMWLDPVSREHVAAALGNATDGPVEEGSVGAGRGTSAFAWKGGIGTSSRIVPQSLGGYTVGVLVQTNFGGNLTMNGVPVGRELGSYTYRRELADSTTTAAGESKDGGSLMIVVATDAPLGPEQLRRVASRAILGAGRTGSFVHDSSGDYVIAFSNAESVRRDRTASGQVTVSELSHEAMSPLFAATVEATEEAIYNAILRATTVDGRGRVLQPIPLSRTMEVLRKYRAVPQVER